MTLTLYPVASGYVVTVDCSLVAAAMGDGRGMHGFHSFKAAVRFMYATLSESSKHSPPPPSREHKP